MIKVQLQILGLSYSQTQDNAYVLILVEDGGDRRMPIIIGGAEAQAIAIELEKMKPPRPLTHDLFKNMAETFDISMSEVLIYRLEEGIFYSKIILHKEDKTIEIDSRTSDAVALAIRFNCPIYTTPEVLMKAGVVLDADSDNDTEPFPRQTDSKLSEEIDSPEAQISFATDDELHAMLDESIETEDYELASKIRDEINKRKNQ
ncbi:MAG: bifunctional nuclease domain-containing protein [Bacteroidales bacterium]